MTLRGLGAVERRRDGEVGKSDECDGCEGGGCGGAISMSCMLPDNEGFRDWGADLAFSRSTIRYWILWLFGDGS
jgi:hypothetical protein